MGLVQKRTKKGWVLAWWGKKLQSNLQQRQSHLWVSATKGTEENLPSRPLTLGDAAYTRNGYFSGPPAEKINKS